MMAADITFESLNMLNADYAGCIDDDRLEQWPSFFTEQCLYKITTADNHRSGMLAGLVYADSRRMLSDRVTALREANVYERQRYRHLIGMPRITGRDGEGVSAETPFLVARIMRGGRTDLFASGKYIDRVTTDQAGELKLAQRIVVCDSDSFDTLVAIPF
jgi:3-phenylpropionate/cinnamic acid dioxygenase small subunit